MAASAKLYQAAEFAVRAGVTVRTLHHYDRLGLLKPSGRTQAGYRLYGEQDFVRLQQIVTLKFIGFPLKQIKELLSPNSSRSRGVWRELDLKSRLWLQREMLVEKRQRMDKAIQAIEQAEVTLSHSSPPDWEAFRRIVEVIEMQSNMEWTKKYYSEGARKVMAERNVPPEVTEQGERDWAALIKDVEAAVAAGEDPKGARGQELAACWKKLIEAFTGGNPTVREGLQKLYADQKNWPATFKKPYSDEVGAFICRASGKK